MLLNLISLLVETNLNPLTCLDKKKVLDKPTPDNNGGIHQMSKNQKVEEKIKSESTASKKIENDLEVNKNVQDNEKVKELITWNPVTYVVCLKVARTLKYHTL